MNFLRNEILNLKGYKKIAIMGGTFNPIHYGHLVSAEFVRQKFYIDKVIFIPTGKPPHKFEGVEHTEHRYIMTQLATAENENFLVSSIEIDRQGTTYTIDTLKQIKEICDEDAIIYFITGIDTINQMISWKEYDNLFKYTRFVVASRPGYKIDASIKNIKPEFKEKIYFCKIPNLEISSTDIRERIDNEKPVDYLLPKSVKEYIFKNNLYKKDYLKKYNSYIQKLKNALPQKRFEHSLQVAKEAKCLAYNYGFSEEKAFLAGILHDCAKCFSYDMIEATCKQNNYTLDEITQKQPDLAHSFLGYFVAKNEYGIEDEEILNAIKYHTTAKPNMTLLEKIIYIADFIEPTRPNFECLERARYLAYENIDDALVFILKNTIQFNKNKGRIIHYLSEDAYQFYK